MIRKCLSIVLCLALVLSVFTVLPFSASAKEADVAETGVTTDFSQPSSSKNSSGDCVSYVRARFKEVYGFELHWPGDNARGYYTLAASNGDTVSSTPRSGALAVWDNGSAGFSHVAFVEKVVGNTVHFTEGGWLGSGGTFHEDSKNVSSMNRNNPYQPFLGFVYVKGTGSAHTHNFNTFAYYGSDHPHYAYYKCSCGDIKVDTSKTSYNSSCSSCNHTVSYNANGGTGAPSSQTKKYLTTLYLSSTKPTRTNYEFLGWSTSSSATTAEYQPGDAYSANNDLYLYAIWALKNYTIKLVDDIDTGHYTTESTPVGKDYSFATYGPYKYYHRFIGWTTVKGSNVVEYTNSGGVSSDDLARLADENMTITLYAIWSAPIILTSGYTVTGTLSINSGDEYFVFTPTETGFYRLIIDIDENSCFFQYNENGGGIGYYGKTEYFGYYTKSQSYFFSLDNSSNTESAYAITLEQTEIVRFKAEATRPQYFESEKYYYHKDFAPIITLYDRFDRVLFKGQESELKQEWGISIFGYQKYDTYGENTLQVELGKGEHVLNYSMKIILEDNPISNISAIPKQEIELVDGCPDCNKFNINKTMDDVSLRINYKSGKTEFVDLQKCGSYHYYNGFSVTIVAFDGEDIDNISEEGYKLTKGKHTVTIEYLGHKTIYSINVVETPVSKISVITTPTVYNNEYNDLDTLLKDQPIKLKISYKDGSSRNVIVDKYSSNIPLQFGDTKHTFSYDLHISWGNSETDSFITISYLGVSVDAYINFVNSGTSTDVAIDYEIINIPHFDTEHFSHFPNLDGMTLKIKYNSGREEIVTLDKNSMIPGSGVSGKNLVGSIYIGKRRYGFSVNNKDSEGITFTFLGNTKRIVEHTSPNTITSIKVINDCDDYRFLTNALLQITYSDGNITYTKRNDIKTKSFYWTDSTWLPVLINGFIDCAFEMEDKDSRSKIEIENTNGYKAKSIAFNIGCNTNMRNGYQYDNKTNDDIDRLVESLPFFHSEKLSEFFIDYTIDFSTAYMYLNQYYGLSKTEAYSSGYYKDYCNTIYIPGRHDYEYGFDERIKLYSETTNSYIFKYSDERKTQYIEISKELKLLSVSGTAPEKLLENTVTLTNGYTSKETAIEGEAVTVCVNVPEGKEFVRWTSDNNDIIFDDATSCLTKFTMVGANVKITPVFIDKTLSNVILGDADGDGEVTIFDATAIQRHLADLPTESFVEAAADADEDGEVTIFDATAIQRHLADLPANKNIGKPIA